MYDVVIIGSGPSGLMVASQIKNKKVLLLEKNNEIALKLKATGNGRCNITNNKDIDDLIKEYNNPKFLYSTFNKFGPYEIINFFESRGLKLKEEDNNRMFPITDKSSDIIEVFIKELEKNNVEVRLNQSTAVSFVDGKFIITSNGKVINSKKLVIATGGNTYHNLGTTGDAYEWLKDTHKITKIYPTESALVSNDKVIMTKVLQGISIKSASITINNKIKESNYDLLFTHFGLSGPLAFRVSERVYKILNNNKHVSINVDLLPSINTNDLKRQIKDNKTKEKTNKLFKGLVQKRILNYILEELKISEKNIADLSNDNIDMLVRYIKEFKLSISDVKGLSHAFVTGGGVSLKEITPNSFKSKRIDDLYIVGELLDIHAHTGGYNITSALSMGYSAAQSINEC